MYLFILYYVQIFWYYLYFLFLFLIIYLFYIYVCVNIVFIILSSYKTFCCCLISARRSAALTKDSNHCVGI